MKLPPLKSLLALGTLALVCSCSDEKVATTNDGDINFVPCSSVWYLPAEGLVIMQDLRVTDINGNVVGSVVNVPAAPNIVIVKDINGTTVIPQLDLTDPNRVKIISGDPTKCTNPVDPNKPAVDSTISTCEAAWYIAADKKYLIYTDLVVTDVAGIQVGTLVASPNSSLFTIIDMSGMPLIGNINIQSLSVIQGDNIRLKITEPAYHLKDATGHYLIYQDGKVTNENGIQIGTINFANGIITSIDGITLTVTNVGLLPIVTPASRCVDYLAPVVSSSSQQPVLSSSSVPPKPKSSSSVVKSSSSVVKSSSSSAPKSSSSKTPSGGCPTIKTKGGASGSGFASRYWDCCMPSCSWNENAGGNPAKVCDSRGKNPIGNGSGSVCSGGGGATCTSQIPFTIDGCEEYGFAFAAVPASNGGQCGKCFQLTFTGEGHYSSTNTNTKKLKSKNKKLIVMATNIGGDVQQGQFDILIPGGGVGMFNGCSQMGWGGQGEQYGGLLSDCEKETSYKAAKYASCLTEKCNKAFSNDSEAKKGCMFLVEWMEAAGNPEHTYVEVECPDVLKQRY